MCGRRGLPGLLTSPRFPHAVAGDCSAALIDNQINDLQDGKSYYGRLQIERALTPTTGLAASFAVDRQPLRDPGYATTGWRAA